MTEERLVGERTPLAQGLMLPQAIATRSPGRYLGHWSTVGERSMPFSKRTLTCRISLADALEAADPPATKLITLPVVAAMTWSSAWLRC